MRFGYDAMQYMGFVAPDVHSCAACEHIFNDVEMQAGRKRAENNV